MHYFEYPSVDATIYQASQSMNTGLDPILEVRKDVSATGDTVNVSRALVKFDLTYISSSVISGLIPSTAKYYLNMYDATPEELTTSDLLYAHPVSQSWTGGTGEFDSNPQITNGVSWKYSQGKSSGQYWMSGSLSGSGATWYSGSTDATNATATITISDYAELNAGDKVNLVATDGNNYDFTNGDQSSVNGTWESTTSNDQTATNLMNVINTSSGPAGTRFNASAATSEATSSGSVTITDYTELNTGDKVNLVATDGNNYDFINGDQSSVNGTWESTTSNDATATNLMNVINTSSGPAGTRFTATVDGAVVTIFQNVVGEDSNTTITLTDSGTAGMTKTDLTGGYAYGVVTITQATTGTAGNTTITLTDSGTTGMSKTDFTGATITGGYFKESGYVASQSYDHSTTDMRMDVTDIMNTWIYSGSAGGPGDEPVPNEGFLVKRSGSLKNADTSQPEGSTTHLGNFSFFSRDTNTIYSPKLEAVWDDSSWSTGSLQPITGSDYDDMAFYVKGLRSEYKQDSKTKIRVVGRARYPEKTYATTPTQLGVKYLPSGSTYYSIKDAQTEEVIIPFGSGSIVSCDSTGNYFNLWLNGLQPERIYNVQFKATVSQSTSNEQDVISLQDHTFKVSR
jgi:hypothetical protein